MASITFSQTRAEDLVNLRRSFKQGIFNNPTIVLIHPKLQERNSESLQIKIGKIMLQPHLVDIK